MKIPFNTRASSFDANAIHETIQRALASAGLDTQAGPMRDVTETIRRALGSQSDTSTVRTEGNKHTNGDAIEVAARVVEDPHVADGEPARPPPMDPPQSRGSFVSHTFTNRAGSRAYKLYVPAGTLDAPPLVVMLHGCTQTAEDFAAGTRMNQLAEQHGFLVAYPEQGTSANPSKCWSWFNAPNQMRDSGEPSLIAGIVREVTARHGTDARRTFVAGLSAGAAMAVILGETYPELFAGVGAHSGLPFGSAHDIASAMAAMKGGRSGLAGIRNPVAAASAPRGKATRAIPTIVFHGDRDHTVQHDNGTEIVLQAANAHMTELDNAALRIDTKSGTSPGGRRYSCAKHVDTNGQTRIEAWTVHGAGHAWSGGSANGTYTDGTGPDASAEMVRFFLALPRSGSA